MSTRRVTVRVYEVEHEGHDIELRLNNSGLFVGLAGAIERTAERGVHESWPCALEQVEEYVANLRRTSAYDITLGQLYNQYEQEYAAYDSAHEYWFQIVTQRNDWHSINRTHVLHLIEETA